MQGNFYKGIKMSQGILKEIAFKEEGTWGTKPSNSGAKLLRRVTGTFQLEKDAFTSNEINTSQQVRDSRHGTRSSTGTLSGELSGGAYADFLSAGVRGTFATGSTLTASTTSLTVAGSVVTIVRAAGSYITDGFKVGSVIRTTGFATAVNNTLSIVVSLTATDLVVVAFDEVSPFVAEAAGAAVTVAVAGKTVIAPLTNQTDKSFTVEEFFPDTLISRTFLGQQVDTVAVAIAPNSMVTADFTFLGRDAEAPTGARYFTAPTAQTVEGTYSGQDGVLIINGVVNRKVTSLSLNIANNINQEPVIGSNIVGAKSRGKVMVTGSLSAIFDNDTILDFFNNESEVSITYALRSADRTEAFAVTLPRVKVNSGTTTDGEIVTIIDADIEALEYVGSASGVVNTTILLQDTTI